MLLLTSTSDKVQLVTVGAGSIDVQASYVDNDAGSITPGRTNQSGLGAATTDIVASPSGTNKRNVKHVSVRNRHASVSVACTLQHTDGSTVAELIKVTLAAGEELIFNDGTGFEVFDASGGLKMSVLPGTGRLLKRTVYTGQITSGTHTFDSRCSMANLKLIGGGGGGGGCSSSASNAAVGGGGGGGAYTEKLWTSGGLSSYAATINVGAGGSAGANTGGNGGNGGQTDILMPGSVTITAPGGTGGTGQTFGTTEVGVAGGAGGVAGSNGDFSAPGESGRNAWRRSGTLAFSGDAGSPAQLGCGGKGFVAQNAGAAGILFGGGGSGGCSLSAAVLGGAGAAGGLIIDEYT